MKKKWLGFGLALLIGTSVAVSDVGMLNVSATGTSNTTGSNTTGSSTTGTSQTGTSQTGTSQGGNTGQTPSTANNAKFTVDGTELVVTENLNPNKYPKDFTETQVECKGKKYKGLKFNHADLQMICLLNQKTGVAAYHIYRDSDQSVYPFIRIESGNDYIIAMPSFLMDDTQVPSGYTQTELEFEKGKAEVYQTQEGGNSYLIYAMDSEGNKSWYEYNSQDKTYQAYQQEEGGESAAPKTETEETVEDASANSQYQELEKELKTAKAKYRFIIAVMILIIAVLATLLINTLLKGRRYQDRDEDETEDDFYEDEGDFYDDYEDEKPFEEKYPEETYEKETEEPLDEAEEEPVEETYFKREPRKERKIKEPKIKEPKIKEPKVEETAEKEPFEKKEEKYESDIEILDLNDL